MFINFFPGDTRDARELFISADAAYGVYEITDVADSVATGTGAISCPLEGAKDALEDGSLWTDEQQAALEEIHALISEHE